MYGYKSDSITCGKLILISVFFLLLFASAVSAREVTLTWDSNNEPDLNHYIVYWGTESGEYLEDSGNIGLVTEFTVEIPDDDQVYYFAVTAVDEAGLESDFSNEVTTGDVPLQTLSFESNWNLISLPNGSGSALIEEILNPILDDIVSVWGFSNGSWKVYDPENPMFSDLFEIDPGQGLWVNMKAGAELTVTGATSADGVELSGGWNLVGFSKADSMDMGEAISSIVENVKSVWAYKNGQWKVYDPETPDFSDLTMMESGGGYWINVESSCVWGQ